MKILLAIKGNEDDGWYGRVARVAALPAADSVVLVHVVDIGPKHGIEQGRERYLGLRPLGGDRLAALAQAEEEAAAGLIEAARAALIAAGVPAELMQSRILHGKRREVIRELAEREHVDLIVVAGRNGKPGPHSVGKTARFLIDHAPTAALLVR
jgi:nucleotide-binding universal stress UspA family protein